MVTKSWMWPVSNGGVNGINIDDIDNKIMWFDNAIACACGDSAAVQSFEEFKQKGPALGGVPQDVLDELHQSLTVLAG